MGTKCVFLVVGLVLVGSCGTPFLVAAKEKKKDSHKLSALERYVEDARRGSETVDGSPSLGSTWSSAALLYDIASDPRASRVNDIVTIVVSERASAVSEGTVSSARTSSASSSIDALGGIPSPNGGLRNLLGLKGESSLEGKGETTRRTVLTATITARVVEALPNGNFVIEGEKRLAINSEEQIILLRGVVRPFDISVANTIRSDQIAQLELKVNGKGVVGDAIRRPNFFYRLLLGLLPF